MSANAAAIGMPVGELETPAMCLDLEAYRRNLRRMADYIIRTHGLAWRAHMNSLQFARSMPIENDAMSP